MLVHTNHQGSLPFQDYCVKPSVSLYQKIAIKNCIKISLVDNQDESLIPMMLKELKENFLSGTKFVTMELLDSLFESDMDDDHYEMFIDLLKKELKYRATEDWGYFSFLLQNEKLLFLVDVHILFNLFQYNRAYATQLYFQLIPDAYEAFRWKDLHKWVIHQCKEVEANEIIKIVTMCESEFKNDMDKVECCTVTINGLCSPDAYEVIDYFVETNNNEYFVQLLWDSLIDSDQVQCSLFLVKPLVELNGNGNLGLRKRQKRDFSSMNYNVTNGQIAILWSEIHESIK